MESASPTSVKMGAVRALNVLPHWGPQKKELAALKCKGRILLEDAFYQKRDRPVDPLTATRMASGLGIDSLDPEMKPKRHDYAEGMRPHMRGLTTRFHPSSSAAATVRVSTQNQDGIVGCSYSKLKKARECLSFRSRVARAKLWRGVVKNRVVSSKGGSHGSASALVDPALP